MWARGGYCLCACVSVEVGHGDVDVCGTEGGAGLCVQYDDDSVGGAYSLRYSPTVACVLAVGYDNGCIRVSDAELHVRCDVSLV